MISHNGYQNKIIVPEAASTRVQLQIIQNALYSALRLFSLIPTTGFNALFKKGLMSTTTDPRVGQ